MESYNFENSQHPLKKYHNTSAKTDEESDDYNTRVASFNNQNKLTFRAPVVSGNSDNAKTQTGIDSSDEKTSYDKFMEKIKSVPSRLDYNRISLNAEKSGQDLSQQNPTAVN